MSDTPKKRTVLTPEEKIAKLEAELQAAREQAIAKRAKQRAAASFKRNKLLARIDDLNRQILAIEEEFPDLNPSNEED